MARIFIEGNHSCQPGDQEYQNAELLGKKLAGLGHTIVSSAHKGVSEAVFVGAMAEDENSVRIAINCLEVNIPRNNKYTKEIVADNYFDMKMKNCINSDAFIFLPGSFAVLSNLAIILQLKELELMGDKPVICFGEQLEEVLNVFGFYNEEVIDTFEKIIHAKNIDEAVEKLTKFFKNKATL